MVRVISIILLFVLLSCTSYNKSNDQSLDQYIKNEIEINFENQNLLKVYQLMTYYESISNSLDFLSETRKHLDELFPQKLDEYYSDNDWENFFITYSNLKKLNYDISKYNYNEILFEYLISNSFKLLNRSAIFLSESRLDYNQLTTQQLKLLFEKFNKISYTTDFPKLVIEMKKRNLEIIEDFSGDNYLDGLLTIYVNKGITFNDGVGNQDLVVGSGFFIDKLGYGITNYHVIESLVNPEYEGKSHLYVKLNGEVEKVAAKVIGWDPVLDLALIKVSKIPDYFYSLSDNYSLNIGDQVTALGSPGGLGSTVTSGIVSAVDRKLLELGAVIQIDSAINPGNSGGPLVDSNKKVTNIVFAGIEEFEGINFAIPVKYLIKKLDSLYLGGQVEHVWVGAGIVSRKNSLEIVYVKPGSPAFYLGLKKGDKLISINKRTFKTVLEIQDYLMDFSPYEIVDFSYNHNGEIIEKKLCLDKRPLVTMDNIVKGDSSDNLYGPLFGMDIRATGKILWNKEYLIDDVYPGTIADELDLKAGDIIEVISWNYNKELESVVLDLIIQSHSEGFWKKSLRVMASINLNFFI